MDINGPNLADDLTAEKIPILPIIKNFIINFNSEKMKILQLADTRKMCQKVILNYIKQKKSLKSPKKIPRKLKKNRKKKPPINFNLETLF